MDAFDEQAQAHAAEPKGLPAGEAVALAAQVPAERGEGQSDVAHRLQGAAAALQMVLDVAFKLQ